MSGELARLESETQDAVTISLSGKITVANAGELESRLVSLRAGVPQGNPTLDVEEPGFISSAGLWVLVRLCRQEPTLIVENASSEVYDVLEVTGLTRLIDMPPSGGLARRCDASGQGSGGPGLATRRRVRGEVVRRGNLAREDRDRKTPCEVRLHGRQLVRHILRDGACGRALRHRVRAARGPERGHHRACRPLEGI